MKLPFKLTEAEIRIMAIVGMMLAAYLILILVFYLSGE